MKFLLPIIAFLISINFTKAQCGSGFAEVKVVLTTDNYASETSWTIKDRFGNTLLSNPTLTNNTTYTSTVCAPLNSCITFKINDTFGDGICCSVGSGTFQIYVDGFLKVNNNGQFGSSFSYNFNCLPGESCNTAIPITLGTYTTPGTEYYYKYKPNLPGLYTVRTCSLTNTCDTKISIYENCNGPFTNDNTGTILYNDNSCGTLSKVSGALDTAKTYIIRFTTNANCNQPITFDLSYGGAIAGCTTFSACNYNPAATVNDGSCMFYPNPLCSGPDLTIVQSSFKNTLQLGTITASTSDCRVNEGCLNGYGTRTVIKFDTYIKNIGNTDYFIGSPSTHPSQFSNVNCHGHSHYEGYAEYKMYKSTGQTIPIGFKNGFCVLDYDGCPDGGIDKYTCSNMGISKQCGDIYSAGLDCQWIDITDIDTGNYVMAAKVNWDQTADALGRQEITYTNNWAQACVKITKNALGVKGFSVLASCPSYSDCAGVLFGNSVVDCLGNCGGTKKMGDLNNSNTNQIADAQMYVTKIIDNSISPTSCNDLNNNSALTVFDAALMVNCAKYGTLKNGKCLFPRGINNPNHTAQFTIGNFNLSQNYFDVYVTNTTTKLLGYEFNISGATILNVVSLASSSLYPVNPDFAVGGTKVISLAYNDSTVPKSNVSQPLCRVYYQNAGTNICLSSVVDVVTKDYETINKTLVNNCIVTTGIAKSINAEHYFSVIPNPATDVIELTGYTKQDDHVLIEIKDISGRILYSETQHLNGLFNHKMDVSNYTSGIYFVTISSKSGVATKPMVITK